VGADAVVAGGTPAPGAGMAAIGLWAVAFAVVGREKFECDASVVVAGAGAGACVAVE
jgi:hypothetical protein